MTSLEAVKVKRCVPYLPSVLQRHIHPSPTEPGQPALQGLLNRLFEVDHFLHLAKTKKLIPCTLRL